MSEKQEQQSGYVVVAASPFEVGLLKNGRGVRTWWASAFGGRMPSLDHPEIQKAIEINERETGTKVD